MQDQDENWTNKENLLLEQSILQNKYQKLESDIILIKDKTRKLKILHMKVESMHIDASEEAIKGQFMQQHSESKMFFITKSSDKFTQKLLMKSTIKKLK